MSVKCSFIFHHTVQNERCLETVFQANFLLLRLHLQLVELEPNLGPSAQGLFHYLGIKLPSIVQEGQADLLESPDFTRVVLEALEHAAAHISSIHQAVLDLS